nr:Na+/H+ antiporter subunit E [Pseudoclavibacter sp. 13-3]
MLTIIVLTVVWCLLWGKADAFTVIGGLLISWMLVALFYLPPLEITGRLHPLSAAYAFVRLTLDIIRASMIVATQALWPWWRPSGAVVRFDLHTTDDLIITLTAEAISLVPGSLVVEIDRNNGVLYVHAFGVRTAADIERARCQALDQEARIIMALGSSSERQAVRALAAQRRADARRGPHHDGGPVSSQPHTASVDRSKTTSREER